MTPKNFSESYMIHHIIIFSSLSFSILGIIRNRNAWCFKNPNTCYKYTIYLSNKYKKNIINTSDKYRTAKNSDFFRGSELFAKWKYDVRLQL